MRYMSKKKCVGPLRVMSMGARQVVRVALGNVCKLKIWSSEKCCVPSVELHMLAESSGQLLITGNTCVQSVGVGFGHRKLMWGLSAQ